MRMLLVGGVILVATWAAPGESAGKGEAAQGGKIYAQFCTSCHGNTGKGDGPAAAALNPRPQNHTDGKYMKNLKDEYLFNIIKSGGAAVKKSPLMPPWGAALKDKDIWNLIAHIRGLAK